MNWQRISDNCCICWSQGYSICSILSFISFLSGLNVSAKADQKVKECMLGLQDKHGHQGQTMQKYSATLNTLNRAMLTFPIILNWALIHCCWWSKSWHLRGACYYHYWWFPWVQWYNQWVVEKHFLAGWARVINHCCRCMECDGQPWWVPQGRKQSRTTRFPSNWWVQY